MPRPRIELTEWENRQVELLAGMGLSQPEVASVLGFSERTFRNLKVVDDEVNAAWHRGKAKMKASIGAVAARNALEGDQRAVEWMEKTRFGITDKTSDLLPAVGASDDSMDAVGDPHEELLRRYEVIAEHYEAAEVAQEERDLAGVPIDHTPPEEADDRTAA